MNALQGHVECQNNNMWSTYNIAGNLIEDGGDICFAFISYKGSYLAPEIASITIKFSTNYSPYDEAEIKRYLKDVASWGFACRYIGIIDDSYHVQVPIYDAKHTYYSKKDHLLSTLTMIRYLYEYQFKHLVQRYFDICAAVGPQKVNTFYAFQMAHQAITGGGHSLFISHTNPTFVKTRKEILTSFKRDTKRLQSECASNIFSHWQGREVTIKANNLKDMYKKVINKEITLTKVYVVGGDTNYANWLPDTELVNTLQEADVVLFTGGEDVHPSLYGEPTGEHTGSNLLRDVYEQEIFNKARTLNKKLLGICRGSQFLCVMAGGKLVQHQDNPKAVHKIHTCDNIDINITSTHHQAAYPYKLSSYMYAVLGWTYKMLPFHLDGRGQELNPTYECEIVHYPKINALGIQGHPEFEHYQRDPENQESLKWLKQLYTNFIKNNL